ncbi:MAG: hypothetical protein WCK71_02770 [bacterium]
MHDFTKANRARYLLYFLLGSVLMLFTAFPYLQLIPSESYTQPFALMLGTFLFFPAGLKVFFSLARLDQIALLGFALVGLGIFFATCFPYDNTQEYKYLVSYLTPILLTMPLLRYVKEYQGAAIKIIKFAIFFWIATAVIQKLFDPNFLGFLIGQWSEAALDIINSGRGVLSLAPEPTHHAFHILLLAACLALLDSSGRSQWILFLCILDAVLLAASSSAILALMISAIAWSLFYRQRWFVIATLVIMFIAILPLDEVMVQVLRSTNSRIGTLIGDVLSEPTNILSLDYSMNVRLGGMAAVVYESFSSLLMPHGMSVVAWETARNTLLADLPWLMDLSLGGPPSGMGQLLFQAGMFGVIFIALSFRRILSPRVGQLGQILIMSSPIIFLSQYYISTPTFSLLYACALFRLGHKCEFYTVRYNPYQSPLKT